MIHGVKGFFFPIQKYHTTDRGVRYQYSTSHWQVISVENTGLKPDCDWVNNVPVVMTNSLGKALAKSLPMLAKQLLKAFAKLMQDQHLLFQCHSKQLCLWPVFPVRLFG